MLQMKVKKRKLIDVPLIFNKKIILNKFKVIYFTFIMMLYSIKLIPKHNILISKHKNMKKIDVLLKLTYSTSNIKL